mmetsp:Transcript_61247/g.173065  ORF Transcript_61247/g.173065 Transcript_61247/m.173065 type:complete len:278 (+) Transcript_61247:967-1800(+)
MVTSNLHRVRLQEEDVTFVEDNAFDRFSTGQFLVGQCPFRSIVRIVHICHYLLALPGDDERCLTKSRGPHLCCRHPTAQGKHCGMVLCDQPACVTRFPDEGRRGQELHFENLAARAAQAKVRRLSLRNEDETALSSQADNALCSGPEDQDVPGLHSVCLRLRVGCSRPHLLTVTQRYLHTANSNHPLETGLVDLEISTREGSARDLKADAEEAVTFLGTDCAPERGCARLASQHPRSDNGEEDHAEEEERSGNDRELKKPHLETTFQVGLASSKVRR